jgi:hypothetical protein
MMRKIIRSPHCLAVEKALEKRKEKEMTFSILCSPVGALPKFGEDYEYFGSHVMKTAFSRL